jgi:hypothetical protein
LESLQVASKRVIPEAVRVKPKVQWRSQEVGEARNMECLLRKAAGSEWSQL